MQESGCRLEHPSATKFRNHVMEGEWDKVSLFHMSLFRPGFIDAAYFKPGLDLNSYKFAIIGVHLEQNNGTDIF